MAGLLESMDQKQTHALSLPRPSTVALVDAYADDTMSLARLVEAVLPSRDIVPFASILSLSPLASMYRMI